jgi:hypothetical protein
MLSKVYHISFSQLHLLEANDSAEFIIVEIKLFVKAAIEESKREDGMHACSLPGMILPCSIVILYYYNNSTLHYYEYIDRRKTETKSNHKGYQLPLDINVRY